MKRSDMLHTKLQGPLDAIQMCRDILEGNFNAHDAAEIDHIELQARIYTDLEILAMNQKPSELMKDEMLVDWWEEDEPEEPSSAAR